MNLHRASIVVVAATAAALGLLPGTATAAPGGMQARAADDVHCLADFVLTFSPGLSMTPSSGTYTSNGDTGTMTCEGSVAGRTFTGEGTRGEAGRYGIGKPNTCADLDGIGKHTWSSTMPTDRGPLKLGGPVDVAYGFFQGGGIVGGTIEGKSMYGEFTVIPLHGDCVTTPLTKVFVHCDEWLPIVAAKR